MLLHHYGNQRLAHLGRRIKSQRIMARMMTISNIIDGGMSSPGIGTSYNEARRGSTRSAGR